MFDINKNKGFVIALGVALVLIIVGIVMWRGAVGSARQAQADLGNDQSMYQSMVRTYGGEPTPELVEKYTADAAALQDAAVKLRQALPQGELPTFTPNGFKDEIKTLQNRFLAISEEKGILIPQEIGESQWIGREVPTEGQLPTLIRQLVTIRDVLTVLLDVEVTEVSAIDRAPQGAVEDDTVFEDVDIIFDEGPAARTARTREQAQGEVQPYTAVPVLFNFRTIPGKLPEVLVRIRNLPQIYRVRTIRTTSELETLGEMEDPADVDEQLAVEMIIDHIVLRDARASEA
jgi:hypothetical protein